MRASIRCTANMQKKKPKARGEDRGYGRELEKSSDVEELHAAAAVSAPAIAVIDKTSGTQKTFK